MHFQCLCSALYIIAFILSLYLINRFEILPYGVRKYIYIYCDQISVHSPFHLFFFWIIISVLLHTDTSFGVVCYFFLRCSAPLMFIELHTFFRLCSADRVLVLVIIGALLLCVNLNVKNYQE